jgi:AcrR family transcriptional regulator
MDTPEWNEPNQARSKAKVKKILDATLELALQHGPLDIKMTEVAKRAGVAVGTLYQFFPSRPALVGRLFAREMEPIDAGLSNMLARTESIRDLTQQVEALLTRNLKLVQEKPGLMVIWASPAVDPAIQAADFAHTQRHADILCSHLRSVFPDRVDPDSVHATALLICHLWSSVIRLCFLSPKNQSTVIIKQYAQMIAAHGEKLSAQ